MWFPHTLKPIICGSNGYPFSLTVSLVNKSPLHALSSFISHPQPDRKPNTQTQPTHKRTREKGGGPTVKSNLSPVNGLKKHSDSASTTKQPKCAKDHNFPTTRTQFAVQRLCMKVHHTQTDVAGTPRFLVILYCSEIGWTSRTQPNINRFIPTKPQGAHKSAESCSLPQRWPTVDRGRSLVSIKTDLPPH